MASPQPPVQECGSSVQSLFPHLHTTENAHDSRSTAKVTAGPLIFSAWIPAVNFLSLRPHSRGSGSPSLRFHENGRTGAMRRRGPTRSDPTLSPQPCYGHPAPAGRRPAGSLAPPCGRGAAQGQPGAALRGRAGPNAARPAPPPARGAGSRRRLVPPRTRRST